MRKYAILYAINQVLFDCLVNGSRNGRSGGYIRNDGREL
jgi:hypothetical protein